MTNTENMDDIAIEVSSETDSNATQKNHCMYTTKVGGFIVNAITGVEYPFRQGSLNSLQLFKVTNSSGILNENGSINRYNINKDPVLTYYDSPLQYQHFTDINVPISIYNKWKSRVNFVFPNGSFSEKNYNKYIKNDI